MFHQKAERVEAHLLVCFPGLAMGRTLEVWMAGKGLGTSARKLVEAVGTIRSMEVSVPVKRGDREVTPGLWTAAKARLEAEALWAHHGGMPAEGTAAGGSGGEENHGVIFGVSQQGQWKGPKTCGTWDRARPRGLWSGEKTKT